MTMRFETILKCAVLLLWTSVCRARNITIDDEYGDEATGRLVSYAPTGSNDPWTLGTLCSACVLRPDAASAYNGTWHDATIKSYNPGPFSFTLLFDGKSSICDNILELKFRKRQETQYMYTAS